MTHASEEPLWHIFDGILAQGQNPMGSEVLSKHVEPGCQAHVHSVREEL